MPGKLSNRKPSDWQLSKRTKTILAIGTAVILIPLFIGLVWWFQRDEGPTAVDLETAIAARLEAARAETEADAGNPADSPEDTAGETAARSDDAEQSGNEDSKATTQAGKEPDGAPASQDGTPVNDQTASTEHPAEDENRAADNDQTDGTAENGEAEAAETLAAETGTDADKGEETVGAGSEPTGIAGLWILQTADHEVDLTGDPAVTFAGFRVNEVLAGGIGDFTAVGRTPDVQGSIELTDTALAAADITVDFTTLRTDNSSRDRQVQKALNTDEFPVAVFALSELVELSDPSAFSGSVAGDLTIKGVTNRAEFQIDAKLVEGTFVVVGSAPVIFADYGVSVPSAPIVVSADDHGVMEFQLFFTR